MKIFRLSEAIEEIKKNSLSDRTLILVGKIPDVVELIKNGLDVNEVILGQLGFSEGKIKIEKTLSMTKQGVMILKEPEDNGIKMIYQQVATEKPKILKIKEFLQKFT